MALGVLIQDFQAISTPSRKMTAPKLGLKNGWMYYRSKSLSFNALNILFYLLRVMPLDDRVGAEVRWEDVVLSLMTIISDYIYYTRLCSNGAENVVTIKL